MHKKIDFKTQRFAVVGIGETGLSIINYLKFCEANIVRVFDTRDSPPNQGNLTNIELICGKLNIENFNNIDVIVISPGVSIYEEALQKAQQSGLLIVGDIELFALAIKSWKSKVIGITGSNGKTTVTTLTGHLLQSLGYKTLVAGNIGVPVLSSFLEITKSNDFPDVIVLELSSFQLESLYSLNLDSATVLNISEDHLDRYRDLLEYAYVKANIFNNCKVQIINSDDALVMAMKRQGLKTVEFGKNNVDFSLNKEDGFLYLTMQGKKILDCAKLQLIGIHNYFNVLASLALLYGAEIDITNNRITAALMEFTGLEHRMQKVLDYNGILFIEDSKGTNVGAVVAGISGLDRPVNLILGGDGKGQDFTPLRDLVKDKCNSVAVIGQDKQGIINVLSGLNLPIEECDTLEEAIDFCYKNAIDGDSVVLSPACASWDMFRDYKHRAQIFVDYANSLVKKEL
ncbi:MAG: UDP-N-acetylmuramoyl-L-alanine--D-glutamate ligase [Neisseriaceae bacterium]